MRTNPVIVVSAVISSRVVEITAYHDTPIGKQRSASDAMRCALRGYEVVWSREDREPIVLNPRA